jgi:hypothetical protein
MQYHDVKCAQYAKYAPPLPHETRSFCMYPSSPYDKYVKISKKIMQNMNPPQNKYEKYQNRENRENVIKYVTSKQHFENSEIRFEICFLQNKIAKECA